MSLATCIQYLRVDSATIVAHHYPKILACILYFYFYSICLSMQKCVDEGLTADAVHVVSDCRPQRALDVVGDDAVTNLVVDGEFLSHARECQFKVAAVGFCGSQTAACISTFLPDPPHQF